MKERNILLIVANTARSQGYAQALLRAGYKFKHTIIINKPFGIALGQMNQIEKKSQQGADGDDLFYPDFSIPLNISIGELSEQQTIIDSGSVNDEGVIEIIKSMNLDLVIYSGFGGEVVSSKVLDIGPRLLHIHSGY